APESLNLPRSVPIRALVAALLVLVSAAAHAAPEPMSGPCRVKLRSGRTVAASSLQPFDETRAFWRLAMREGGAVVLPVREIRSVMREDGTPLQILEPPTALDGEATGATACATMDDVRLARWNDL